MDSGEAITLSTIKYMSRHSGQGSEQKRLDSEKRGFKEKDSTWFYTLDRNQEGIERERLACVQRQQKPADSGGQYCISGRKCDQQRQDCEKLNSEIACKESFRGRK